jgi:uncharacterized protein (TIGR03083 family)
MEMTTGAIAALHADREAILKIGAGLTDAEWAAPSGCPGWSAKDVLAHLGALLRLVIDPASLPDATGLETEQAQEMYVESRRSWAPARVLADYEWVSLPAFEALTGLAAQDFAVPLGDLGTYPAALVPNAMSFDHYTHIRADLFPPRGPLAGPPPPSDELRLVPVLDWIEAALPQQNAGRIAALTGGVRISVTGPGARTLRLGPGDPVAEISSDAPAFIRWVTQRGSWAELGVRAHGDERQLHVAAGLKVF